MNKVYDCILVQCIPNWLKSLPFPILNLYSKGLNATTCIMYFCKCTRLLQMKWPILGTIEKGKNKRQKNTSLIKLISSNISASLPACGKVIYTTFVEISVSRSDEGLHCLLNWCVINKVFLGKKWLKFQKKW